MQCWPRYVPSARTCTLKRGPYRQAQRSGAALLFIQVQESEADAESDAMDVHKDESQGDEKGDSEELVSSVPLTRDHCTVTWDRWRVSR